MEAVLVLDDIPFVGYVDNFTFVRMKLHLPLLFPFSKVVKVSLECVTVLGGLDRHVTDCIVCEVILWSAGHLGCHLCRRGRGRGLELNRAGLQIPPEYWPIFPLLPPLTVFCFPGSFQSRCWFPLLRHSSPTSLIVHDSLY